MNDSIVSLNRNEYFFDHHPQVIRALIPAYEEYGISCYAKPEELQQLKKELAMRLNVDCNRLMLAHGAEDVFVKLLCYFRSQFDTVIVEDFSWTNYLHFAQGFSYQVVSVPSRQTDTSFLFPLDSFQSCLNQQKPSVVFITSPNNPTGHSISTADFCDMAAMFPQHLFILDSVYNHIFLPDYNRIFQMKNVIFIGSFSKFFGMPGLRLGYAVGSLPQAFQLNLGLQPSAIRAARCALEHIDWYDKNRQEMLDFNKTLHSNQSYTRVKIFKSDAPFFLAQIPALTLAQESMLENEAGIRPKFIQPENQNHHQQSQQNHCSGYFARFGLGPCSLRQKVVSYLHLLEQVLSLNKQE